jgi:PAS domain-containing protein
MGRNLIHSTSAHDQLIHELSKSEARYRTVANAAFDAIVAIAPDGVVQWFSRGAEHMFGHSAEKSSEDRSC